MRPYMLTRLLRVLTVEQLSIPYAVPPRCLLWQLQVHGL
jgi:hypothetical protein